MKNYQEDLLQISENAFNEHEIFRHIQTAAKALGWDYCAYGLRLPMPLSNPKILMLNNYSEAWQKHYHESGYLFSDPTVIHGRKSQKPLIWSEQAFSGARELWDDARTYGLKVGWAQSSLDGNGVGGMLSLSRSGEVLTPQELVAKESQMRWLVNFAHLSLSRILLDKTVNQSEILLTPRELEVLKWTADGKSAQETADILNVTKHVIDFHIKNAIVKLKTANKTAAVVKAAMLGLLN